jgi:hypothetical protein
VSWRFIQEEFLAFCCCVGRVKQIAPFVCRKEQDVEDEHQGEDTDERGRRSSCLRYLLSTCQSYHLFIVPLGIEYYLNVLTLHSRI